jgi:lambda repressor-like predicted transcriptional regulator
MIRRSGDLAIGTAKALNRGLSRMNADREKIVADEHGLERSKIWPRMNVDYADF